MIENRFNLIFTMMYDEEPQSDQSEAIPLLFILLSNATFFAYLFIFLLPDRKWIGHHFFSGSRKTKPTWLESNLNDLVIKKCLQPHAEGYLK